MSSANAKPLILYIEDDPGSRMLVKRVLESEGYRVAEAVDGLSGIEAAQKHPPDLILLDVNLGAVSGHEVATKLKSIPSTSRIPIVALTAATVKGDRERALVAGCDGYIAKPVDVDTLPEQVRKFLGGAHETVGTEERAEKLEEYSRSLVDRLQTNIIELQKANEELRRVDKMKSDFVILASHELRTPLTLVYGYVNLLKMELGQLPPAGRERLDDITRRLTEASARLAELYDTIINVSLIDSNRLDLALKPIDLFGVITSVVNDVGPIVRQRNLRLTTQDFRGLPRIHADPDYLRRAIANLVNNAIKYTPDAGTIDIAYVRRADTIDIVVADTGIGIDRSDQERIFQKFVVAEDIMQHSTSQSSFLGGGMGLGLTVVRGIVEAHGGRVWVESEGRDPDRLPGATFHVLLPMPGKSE